MVDPARARKLAVRIHEIVAETLRKGVKDPRLGMITVTDAKVTGDLHDATVFYTVYGDESEQAATAAALESAKGVIRSEVGRRTGVRFTPTLTFTPDIVPDTARHLDELIDLAKEADAEVQRKAADAHYAGDADPYRPEPEEDDALDAATPTGERGDGAAGGAADRTALDTTALDTTANSVPGPVSGGNGRAGRAE